MSIWIPAVITETATLAGVIATVWVAVTSRQHTVQQDALAFHRARRADAYVEALTLVERFGQWFVLAMPDREPHEAQEDPPLPDWAEASHARAVMSAHGSPEAKELFELWFDLRAEVQDVRLHIDYSPCPGGYRCQDLLDQQLPAGSDISYSHPWQPRSAQDTSRENLANDIDTYFRENP